MLEKLKLDVLRWLIRQMVRFNWRGKVATELSVTNETLAVDGGRIAVRIYRPNGSGPFPVLHFIHGGGWVGCDLVTHDPLCRDLCVQSQHLVVSFDYRLAPEHPFPIPINDCLATLDWIKANAQRLGGDPQRIVLCGDSAGGNLAAVTAQQARVSHPGMIKGQVLIYPVTDNCGLAQWPSYKTYGTSKFALPHAKMVELWQLYLRNSPVWTPGLKAHDLATPLLVENLGNLPPSFTVIADEDLLCDEGAAYAQRMKDAGNDAQLMRYPGQQHGFVGLTPTPAHRQAVADIARWLSTAAL